MTSTSAFDRPKKEELSLSEAARYLLDECRMVLPGIQALFGFQLIAVFNSTFAEKLTPAEQSLHLVAIGLASVAIALVMTPAALHRQTSPRAVTAELIDASTRLLLWSMVPLAASIALDFYLIARIITGSDISALLAAALFGIFATLWFVLPRASRLSARIGAIAGSDR